MANRLTVVVDYVSADGGPEEPVWNAYWGDEPDPVDTWCLMWRSGCLSRLRSVRTLKDFFADTPLVGPEFDKAVALFMSQTLGAVPSALAQLSCPPPLDDR